MAMDIEFHQKQIYLLPTGGLYIPEENTLVVADLHLGKGVQLQDQGTPFIPQLDTQTVQKLLSDLRSYSPKLCIVCGDLIHARTRHLADHLKWFESCIADVETKFVLTLGNHDSSDLQRLIPRFDCVNQYDLAGLVCAHYRLISRASISGHIHPGVQLKKGRIRQYYKAFAVDEISIILPSYGTYTGAFCRMDPSKKYYYISDGKVYYYTA
jgi:DNA ligase-associated metallophosphoesterase